MNRIRFLITIVVAFASTLASHYLVAESPAAVSVEPARGRLLVASRSLDDPRFRESVVYLVEHGNGGTLGLIINRPGDMHLAEAVPDLDEKQASTHTMYFGGPVGLQMILMLVRTDSTSEGLVHVADDVYVSSARIAFINALMETKPPGEVRFFVGHSGWAPGQLDFELVQGSWHVVDGDTDIIFSRDMSSLWNRLIEQLEPDGIQADSGRIPFSA